MRDIETFGQQDEAMREPHGTSRALAVLGNMRAHDRGAADRAREEQPCHRVRDASNPGRTKRRGRAHATAGHFESLLARPVVAVQHGFRIDMTRALAETC
jgi:hypothetical protein